MNRQKCPKCGGEFNIVRTFANESGELRTTCGNCGVTLVPEAEVEITEKQSERCDQINRAVYDCIKVITENPDMKYDMNVIGDITDTLISAIIAHPGISDKAVHYPGVVTDSAEGSQHIEELVYR